MNPLLLAVCAALGLAATTTEEQAVAALSAFSTDLRKLLEQDDKANGEAVLAACTSLKAKVATSAPDPAQFVPVAVVEGLKGDIAALTARLGERDQKDLDTEIAAALADGRLHTTQETWARDLGKSDRAALTAYLDTAAPIAALAGSQTRGKEPVPDEKTGLTAEEQAVCSRMGLTTEQFKAAKEA